MIIVVTGTREHLSLAHKDMINNYSGNNTLVHGGCTGVDLFAASVTNNNGWMECY